MLRINKKNWRISPIVRSVMDQKRFSPTLVNLRDSNGVLMIGGRNEVCLGAVSHHDLTDNKWTHTIAKLNIPRRSAGGCFIKGVVYIVGGHSDTKPLNCIERITAVRIVEN